MKEKFIKSTIILLIGGFITKIIGLFNRIILGRMLGSEGMGMYMLILPTFILVISLGQFGLPKALSKLVAEDNKNTKVLYFSILPLTIIINTIIMIFLFISSTYISKYLLHNNDLKISLIAIGFVVPFTSISSICRSYFFGKQKMFPHVFSNIVEDLLRLFLLYFLIPIIKPYGLKYTICFLILINIISEASSTIILLLFLPKKVTIKRRDLVLNSNYIKDTLKISIPNTSSRLIGSFSYFLEPIILTNILIFYGYNNTYITTQYGIISGYILPILLLPSFFTNAISDALLPIISNYYVNYKYKLVKRKIIQGLILSFIIGVISTIFIFLFGSNILYFLYNTRDGIKYMYFLAPFCLLEYIQSPLSSTLDAIGKSIDNMKAILIGSIIRILGLVLFSIFKIGIWSLVISISLNIIIVTIYELMKVINYFK